MDADAIVVGGGPIGAIAAHQIAKANKEVTLFERRKIIGEPDHCAGLLSTSGLKILGLNNLPSNVVQNKYIRGAKFYSPLFSELIVQRKRSEAIVVDRTKFDQFLIKKAKEEGAKIKTNCKIESISYSNNKALFHIAKKNKPIISHIGIIAEGGRGSLSKKILPKTVSKNSRLSGYQVLVEDIHGLDSEFVELYLDERIAPGFFCWIIPISKTIAKVGLASKSGSSVKLLDYFMKKYKPVRSRFSNSNITKKYGGEVIVRGTLNKTHANGFLVVGDAAGQTKSTTGGGVITGGVAARIAGNVAVESINLGDNSSNLLKKYDKLWKRSLGRQFRIMSFLRWFLDHITNKGLDQIFRTIINNNLINIIEEKGDIDKQAEIILTLLKNPHILKMAFNLLSEIK